MSEPNEQPAASAVVDPSGRVVEADNVNLGTLLDSGYRLASPEEIQAERDRQQYGEGFASEAAAFGEGALSGATLGLSDVAARAISPEYAAELAKRREYNPTAAGLGEGAGILGATLLTGGIGGGAAAGAEGAGLLARGGGALARAATAPTRALVGLGEAVTAGTGRLLGAEAATSALGQAARQAAAYGAGGATEGALFGAAKVATDDFLNDHEITAERILAGAGTGALTGGVLGAGIGGGSVLLEKAAEGVKNTVWPALKKAIDADGSFDDFVGKESYKASLGGRNLKDVQRSERYGGPAEIGQTQLRYGVVTPKSTSEDIMRVAGEKAAEVGTNISGMVDELDALAGGGAPAQRVDIPAMRKVVADEQANLRAAQLVGDPGRMATARQRIAEAEAEITRAPTVKAGALDGQDLWGRIEREVIAPLKKSPVLRDIGEQVERKTDYLREALTRTDAPPPTFRDLWELRKDMDTRLRYDKAPQQYGTPDPTLEAMRDVRRSFDEAWQEAGDRVAREAATPDWLERFQAAKRDYSHLKHTEEISRKAIARDTANRMFSPSDYGVGAMMAGADAVTGGGASLGSLAYGLASGAVHKFFRERGNAMFAGTMYALRGAPKLVKDARAGEQLAEAAGKGFIDKALQKVTYLGERVKNTAAAAGARRLSSPEALEEATRKAAELTNPDSPQRQEMQRRTAAVRVQYPALGAAMDQKTQQVADFLASKAGPISSTPMPGDPFGHLRKPRQNPAKAEKLARYVDAATNPRGALERISQGELVREDVEVLQQLYPRLYQRVRDEVLMNLSTVDTLPSYDARLKLGILLGAPTDPSMTPQMVQALQKTAQAGRAQQEQAGQSPTGEPVLSPSQRREPKLGKMYATQTDAQSVQGSELGG